MSRTEGRCAVLRCREEGTEELVLGEPPVSQPVALVCPEHLLAIEGWPSNWTYKVTPPGNDDRDGKAKISVVPKEQPSKDS